MTGAMREVGVVILGGAMDVMAAIGLMVGVAMVVAGMNGRLFPIIPVAFAGGMVSSGWREVVVMDHATRIPEGATEDPMVAPLETTGKRGWLVGP